MRRMQTVRWVAFFFLIGLLAFANPARTVSAGMTDYCQVPPYVVQNIPPNVLILLDVSRSMQYFAYYDGSNTPGDTSDDRLCNNSALPCTNFTTGRPATGYYGYFDPNQWYTYGSNVFSPVGPRTATNPNHYWSGDFLNWLTMRRIDVMRKVLTGGKPDSNKLTAWKADGADLGTFKRITAAELSANTPFTDAAGGDFELSSGGSPNSEFTVYRAGTTTKLNAQAYMATVAVPLPVEGVLQQTVGARARVGLMLFHATKSGDVVADVGKAQGSLSSLASTINQINLSAPTVGATPLAEALWAATGYFAQQSPLTGFASGPGPSYGSGSYTINANNDPMNFGTGGSGARYPVCQKNFVMLLTDGDPYQDGNIPAGITSYGSNSTFNCSGTICPALSGPSYSFPYTNLIVPVPAYGTTGVTSGIEDVALHMHTKDLRNNPTIGADNIAGFQNLTLYTIFAFGRGSSLLKFAAINGGFENSGPGEWPSTGATSNWDKNGDGVPDTYFEATEGAELEQAVRDAFSGILKRASSGTAASVLASGEGSGANLIQAVFYPRRAVGNDIIWWTGALQNMWYYVDPFFANATIREDTDHDEVLNLANDDIVQFYFDPVSQLTQVRRWHSDSNGLATTQDTTLSFENINSLWEAGKKLWQRDISVSGNPRTIYTTLNGSTLIPFSVGNATLNSALLPDMGDNETTIINYVHGIDNTDDLNLRPRTVTFGSDNNVWKLGDVVNSTPRIVASVPLNKYDTVYNDTTYKSFIDNTTYKNRGIVFTGGNDGMLHAFRLGKLELSWTGKTLVQKARITNPYFGTTLGDEAWAFIPKNALPYLKYLKDPDYCHLYYADLAPYVFDASIGSGTGDQSRQTRTQAGWRTVLIGGMRTGGACDNSVSCTTANNCVKTPGGGAGGFSSYFALDVTDPTTPSLMWEFTNPALGFTTTGPAVVRINGLNASNSRDQSLNGEWYVVFGSGPTGPIDNTNNQFLGRSNQPLNFFVLNLKTGALVQTIGTGGITEAFAGSMINAVADFNIDYQDDAIYVGYVKKVGSGTSATWTDGGVGRILTANTTPTDAGGGSWKWSKVIDGTVAYPIGPVTSAIARLQNTNLDTNWLFFGTGRYFFENPPTGTNTTPDIDDSDGQRRLFAIKDPCFIGGTINPTTCVDGSSTSSVAFSTLTNVTSIGSVPAEGTANLPGFKGWYISLDPSANYIYDNVATRAFRAERVITDPLATTSGVVFFTTYKPYGDECALGGKSFLWALRYNTGGAPSTAVMKGKALVQVSTASVEQLDLSTAFQGDAALHKDGRRTGAIEGVPPTAQGLSLLSQPPPVKRIMHMMER